MDENVLIEYFDVTGKPCDQKNPLCVAKYATSSHDETRSLLFLNGEIYNHRTAQDKAIKRGEFKQVNARIYDKYLKYLTTSDSMFYKEALKLYKEG